MLADKLKRSKAAGKKTLAPKKPIVGPRKPVLKVPRGKKGKKK